jgi:hypothetical protein
MITGAAGADRDPEGGRMPDRIRNPTSRRAEDKAKRSRSREGENRSGDWPRVCGNSPLFYYVSGDRPHCLP